MFEDSHFDWHKLKASFGERAFEIIKEHDPSALPLDEKGIKDKKASLAEKHYKENYYPKTASEYKEKFLDNMQVCQMDLEGLQHPISSEKLLELHSKMQSGITKKDQYNCGREAKFLFLPDGENNMVMKPNHVKNELDLLDQQTEQLFKNANTKEEKVRVALFQGLRWVGIHPANDGNKRIMKMSMNHALSELGMNPQINKKWDDIAPEVFKQAIHGNNLSGFLKATEQLYDVDLKVKDYEIPPYKMMPERDQSKDLTLESSRIHEGNSFSNSSEFCRYDDDLLKHAKQEIKPFKFKAKMALSKLKLQLNANDALKEVNKLDGAISEKTLTNLRYMCGVSESGYQPYLNEAIHQGKLDNSIKKKFVRPIVIKTSDITRPSKDLSNLVRECTESLSSKTQYKSLTSTVKVGTIPMNATIPMSTQTSRKL